MVEHPRSLSSWKEIAAHLGVSPRTAQQWERYRGLPVHRPPGKRGTVWANTSELTEWRASGGQGPGNGAPAPASFPTAGRRWFLLAVVLVAAATAVAIFAWTPRMAPRESPGQPAFLTAFPGRERGPGFSPDGQEVVFAWKAPGRPSFDLFLQSVEGAPPRPLLSSPGDETSPVLSPDGERVAFLRTPRSRAAELWLARIAGCAERRVAGLDIRPTGRWNQLTWTRDGKWIICPDRKQRAGPVRLVLCSAETGEKRWLTDPPAASLGDSRPAVSPDGRRVVFVRTVSRGSGDVYLASLPGRSEQQQKPIRLTSGLGHISRLAWVPDGSDVIVAAGGRGRLSGIWRVPSSGGEARLVFSATGSETLADVAVSPAGDRVAYAHLQLATSVREIVLDPAGRPGEDRPLFATTLSEANPAFSPDGARIAFDSFRSGVRSIWVGDADGTNACSISPFPDAQTAVPRWSPNGHWIAFESNIGGQWDVYVIDLEGGGWRRLTDNAADDFSPNWSSDGNWVYFCSRRTGEYQIWKIAVGGGPAIQVTRDGGTVAAESFDGRWVYFVKDLWGPLPLWRVPVGGGAEEKLSEPALVRSFWLTRTGIYYTRLGSHSDRTEIRYFDFATNSSRHVAGADFRPRLGLSVSPDGNSLLFSVIDQWRSDLLMLENFQ